MQPPFLASTRGGDVVNDGPSSIVRAAAAGKAIADSILRRHLSVTDPATDASFDAVALLRRRSQRKQRVPVSSTPLADREKYTEVVLTYTEQQARTEAARCLDCDVYCSLCVGVCPNLALQTYKTDLFEVRLPELRLDGNEIQVGPGTMYRVDQPFQVAVLADLCNECGNCTTFCPTSGQPYRDKPRIFLDLQDFEEQADNAFMLYRDGDQWAMDARWHGTTHRVELNGSLDYSCPSFTARVNPATFEVERIEPTGIANAADPLSLQPCAEMYVLLKGLQSSMPFLPTARPGDVAAAGKIAHPGYEE